jgi:hypothetical protein
MGNLRKAFKDLVGKPEGKIPLGNIGAGGRITLR